jgi:anti-anti-sigma factor
MTNPTRLASNETQIHLAGPFNADGAPMWRDTIESLAGATARRVIIDLTDVSVMDGTGVGALAFLFKRLVARGRKLIVTGVSGQPLALLNELGLADLLGIPASLKPKRAGLGGLAIAGGH